MKVLVSGSRGLIGSALLPFLRRDGQVAAGLGRGRTEGLEGADAIVHLAGEPIDGRWTKGKKSRIRESRIEGTTLLARALARLERPPAVLVCASAVGYYGDRGDEILTEASAAGSGFLAGVCREWEEAAAPAAEKGIRVVFLRFGMVLSRAGGAWPRLLLPFRFGVGGPIGSGRQWWSWIAIDDAVRSIAWALGRPELRGPVNAVSPAPARNRDFARALGRSLGRPALIALPAFAARLALGEMAVALLLSSERALPRRLDETGFQFLHPTLEDAIHHLVPPRS